MNIIEKTYKWNGSLAKRKSTKYIILHNRAGNGDIESIHSLHLSNGWTGIGYHFYVRKDGSVYRGRPIDTVGAHTIDYNSVSVGVCFEGNYDKESAMSEKQIKAGQELIAYLKKYYPSATLKKHRDFNATSCPGKNFPYEAVCNAPTEKKQELVTTANDIAWELNHSYFPITEMDKFVKSLEEAKKENSSLYWGYYKLVNKIK